MPQIPQIRLVMTTFPYSIGLEAPLAEARELMRRHGIRHLPVTRGHELVGILTDRDVKRVLGRDSDRPPEGRMRVEDVYLDKPYVVESHEPLDNVLLNMSDMHIGSALVTHKGKLAGLFTVTDACRCFGEFLRQHYRPPEGDDAA